MAKYLNVIQMFFMYKNFPETPGVYIMKGEDARVLYVGKASNLKRRVGSYFMRSHDARIEHLVSQIRLIEYKKTESVLEALMLESELIKKYQPPFNVREKDNKSFLYVEFTQEDFPRVLLVRGRSNVEGERFGPFVSASDAREAMRILRKIFPWNVHEQKRVGKEKKPCFDYQIGLCPGTCIGVMGRREYQKQIRYLKDFFEGKKKKIIGELEKEMKRVSKNLEFEKAEKIKHQIFALQHIQDTALVRESDVQDTTHKMLHVRIEGYDISNISGTSAVGSMVVFENGKPKKDEYKKFKIKTVIGSNDVAMLGEVLRRRFSHNWIIPDIVLVDGGVPQVNIAKKTLRDLGISTPVVGIAKGPERKKNEFVGDRAFLEDENVLIKVRDEAHRFAVAYHRDLRGKNSLR